MTTTHQNAQQELAVVVPTRVVKEGWAKKRSGRMHQWTSRYFTLTETGLTYKLKPDSTTLRGQFDFVSCGKVTDIIEESLVKMKNNKLYTFWIVNPRTPNDKATANDDKNYDSDEEDGPDPAHTNSGSNAAVVSGSPVPSNRNLQHIVRNELNTQKLQKELAEEQVDRHATYDNNVANGALVAAVAVGGVVVGAMTMGIGLIPYFAVVGITAAAGGGAVVFNSRRRPDSSRLIMAFETNKEAAEWKAAIEAQIRYIAETRRPMLPDSVDAKTISAILDLGQSGYAWKRVAVYEGVCVLEHITFENRSQGKYKYHPLMNMQDQSPFYLFWQRLVMDPEYMKVCIEQLQSCYIGCDGSNRGTNRVRKAQLSVCCSPVDTFLALMNTEYWCWPRKGSFKVIREIDDHADIICVEIVTNTTKHGGKSKQLRRRMCLSRFWQLDDDGVYLVTYSSVKDEAYPPSVTVDDASQPSKAAVTINTDCDVQFDAVVTIAPRHDVANNDTEIPEAMVTCICQVGLTKGNWQKGEVTALMECFLKDNLLELRETLWNNKFGVTPEGVSLFGSAYAVTSHDGAIVNAVERMDSGESYMPPNEYNTKLSSPQAKSKRSFSPSARAASTTIIPTTSSLSTTTSATATAANTAANAGAIDRRAALTALGRTNSGLYGTHGVTTVQPGMEEDGHRMMGDTDIASLQAATAAAAAPKKKMGFLQRMTSSTTSGHKDKDKEKEKEKDKEKDAYKQDMSYNTSPTGPLRKHLSTGTAGLGLGSSGSHSDRGRSVSPVPLVPSAKSKTSTGSVGTPLGSFKLPGEGAGEQEFSDANPLYQSLRRQSREETSPPTSPLGSPSGLSSSKHNSSKSRDKKTNAEASKLRNHISMTEYEIARLSKTLRKRLATIQALEQAVHEHNLKHDNKNVVADQQEVLELNSDVQSLNGQIAILTNRQNDLKEEYLRLIGEPFEPSKGTRGMMERWKGARLAQKELKGQSKERENNRLSAAGMASPQQGLTHTNSAYSPYSTTTTAANAGHLSHLSHLSLPSLRRSYSNGAMDVSASTPRPYHWSPRQADALAACTPRQLASLPAPESVFAWLIRMLTSTPQECEAHAQAVFAVTGGAIPTARAVASNGGAAGLATSAAGARARICVRRAASATEMAQLDVKAANLVLVVLFTAMMVVVSVLSSMIYA